LSHFKPNTVWLGEIFEASGVTQSHSKLEKFLPVIRNHVCIYFIWYWLY